MIQKEGKKKLKARRTISNGAHMVLLNEHKMEMDYIAIPLMKLTFFYLSVLSRIAEFPTLFDLHC